MGVCVCVYYSLFSLTSSKSAGCQQWTFGEPLSVPVPSVLWASRSRGTAASFVCRIQCKTNTYVWMVEIRYARSDNLYAVFSSMHESQSRPKDHALPFAIYPKISGKKFSLIQARSTKNVNKLNINNVVTWSYHWQLGLYFSVSLQTD